MVDMGENQSKEIDTHFSALYSTIMHVDMDAFYASVEQLDFPEYRGKPIAVGGMDKGVISTASYEARKFGVRSAMPVYQAKKVCPQLIMRPVRMMRYQEVSAHVMDILGSVTPVVEKISIDEAFIDVAGSVRLFGAPVQIAQYLRSEIKNNVGISASVGIANVKYAAKMASDCAKPDGLLYVSPEETLSFVQSRPVRDLWGVGAKTLQILQRQGIHIVGDIANISRDRLVALLGQAQGIHLYELAHGIDTRKVHAPAEEKSISSEQTFYTPLYKVADVEEVMLSQAHVLARKLRGKKKSAKTISIKIKFSHFQSLTRSRTLIEDVTTAEKIYNVAKELLRDIDVRSGVRLVGLRVSQLNYGAMAQLDIFGDSGRQENVEKAMDKIKDRFGSALVSPASLVKNELKAENSEKNTGKKKN